MSTGAWPVALPESSIVLLPVAKLQVGDTRNEAAASQSCKQHESPCEESNDAAWKAVEQGRYAKSERLYRHPML